MMTMTHERPSAQIIAFPLRPRLRGLGLREADRNPLTAMAGSLGEGGIGESWYHAAAIRDAERAPKP